MAISATLKAKMNKMNRVAKDAGLGDVIYNLTLGGNLTSGSWAVTAAQGNASAVNLVTGLSAVRGWILQSNTSGSITQVLNSVSGSVAGVISVTAASGSKIYTGDVINYIAF